jgi:chromosome segregation ATPase
MSTIIDLCNEVIAGVPIASIGVVGLSFAAAWWLLNHHHARVVALRDQTLVMKDATIESTNERLRLADDRLKDALRERDQQAERLGRVVAEPDKLKQEVQNLRAQLEERQRREWPLMTSAQKLEAINKVTQ